MSNEQEPKPLKDRRTHDLYTDTVEAHIIADMLRIESITTELKEFKTDTKERLSKIEGWVVSIIGVTVTTLLATIGSIVFKVFT